MIKCSFPLKFTFWRGQIKLMFAISTLCRSKNEFRILLVLDRLPQLKEWVGYSPNCKSSSQNSLAMIK